MEKRISVLVIASDGEHLAFSNRGVAGWEALRRDVLPQLVDHLVGSSQPGAHAMCMFIASGNAFQFVQGQKPIMDLLSGVTRWGL